jgi:hypothetical protein
MHQIGRERLWQTHNSDFCCFNRSSTSLTAHFYAGSSGQGRSTCRKSWQQNCDFVLGLFSSRERCDPNQDELEMPK